MKYNHIDDCWNAARKATSIKELKEIINNFPRWSGNWFIDTSEGKVSLINTYWDENLQEEFEDEEDLDIELDESFE